MKTRLASSLVLGVGAIVLATGAVLAIGQAAPPPPPTQGRGAPPDQGRGAGGGRGQQPARDAQNQPAAGTGAISGFVVTEGTGTAVRRARVSLAGTGGELRGGRSAISDDQGRFSFVSLPAGRFNLSASKAGYVDIAYGAKRPGRPGTPIQLADGQRLEKAVLTLPRGSVVTGVVVDEHGEPSPGTTVRVMRYVIRTGEKTLTQAGTDTTDDRGVYRVYALQPGDYMVSAAPRNLNVGNIAQTIASEVEMLMAQLQAQGGRGGPGGVGGGGGGGGRGGGRGAGGLDPATMAGLAGGRGGQQLVDRMGQLQAQLAQAEQEQSVAYAPVYFPGTTSPSSATTVTLGTGEERNGVDFQLQLVATAKVEGTLVSFDGTVPQGTQIALVPSDRAGMPSIPGVGSNSTRVQGDGKFAFQNVTPGQYTLQARATIRDAAPVADTSQPAGRGAPRGGGPGGRGGPGSIAQVLWASQDVSVSGQPVTGVTLTLQPGMTVTGRVDFRGASAAPTDLTRVRVQLSPRGQQTFEAGNVQPAVVDAAGQFVLHGVAPGRYAISANVAGGGGGARAGGAAGQAAGQAPGQATGQWTLQSAVVAGRDVMDFPVDIAPNQGISGALLTFSDRTQELSGTIQDSSGRATSDFTIIVFPVDNRYWLPQARRISSARPGTDGKFTLRGLPAGDYRLTAVTDVEPGEWYDPALLTQLVPVSIPVTIAEGEKKVQDIRVAGGH